MHIESTQPWVEAKLKIPISKRIKDVVGRVAGKAGILDRDFRSKMVIVAFHRIRGTLPEGGLNYSSARFEKFCEFCKSRFKVIPLSVARRYGEDQTVTPYLEALGRLMTAAPATTLA
jgi:hypothetical protein